MIQIKNMNIQYGDLTIIKKTDIEFFPGVTCIIGRSGTGKSSLLNALTNKIEFSCDEYTIGNTDLIRMSEYDKNDFIRRHYSYLVQGENFISDLTCYDNIRLYCEMIGKNISDEEIKSILESVGLQIDKNVFPDRLSGGQKQRLAIAQAVAKDSDIILCDEITSALDEKNKIDIVRLLHKIANEMNKIIIITSHDEDIFDMCDALYEVKDKKIHCLYEKNTEKLLNRQLETQSNKLKKQTLRHYLTMKTKRQFKMSVLYSLICALVVSASVFLTYYLYSFVSIQKDTLKVLSPTEITVINQTIPNFYPDFYTCMYNTDNQPFENEIFNKITNVNHVNSAYPFYFGSVYESMINDEEIHKLTLTIDGKTEFCEYSSRDSIYVIPYYGEQNFEKVQECYSNEEGAYVNQSFLYSILQMDTEDLIGKNAVITMKIATPISYKPIEGSVILADNESVIETTLFETHYKYIEITIPIIGIVDRWYSEETGGANIYLPFSYMEKLRVENSKEIILPEEHIEWSPNAYKVYVDDYSHIDATSKEIMALNENINTGSFYTNMEANYNQESYIKWLSIGGLLAVLSTGIVLAYSFGLYYYQKNRKDVDYFERNGLTKMEFANLLKLDILNQTIIITFISTFLNMVTLYLGMRLLVFKIFAFFSYETLVLFVETLILSTMLVAVSRIYYYKKIG